METTDQKLDRLLALLEAHTVILLPKKEPVKAKKKWHSKTSEEYAMQYVENLRKSKSN
jgi:hypothetical protein